MVYVLNGLKYRYKIIHYDSKLNCLISMFLEIITRSMYETKTDSGPCSIYPNFNMTSRFSGYDLLCVS